MNNYKVLYHSSIKIDNIYIDPYNIINEEKADYIFITHSHYDHLSLDDIKKLLKKETIIICTKDSYESLRNNLIENEIIIVEPNNDYKVNNISFKTVNSYNKNKTFHPKDNNWVGYIINYNNINYYIAGDTDYIEELNNINCDIAFIPIGGTYTMNYEEAASLVNNIKPKKVIPTHYNAIVGSKLDEEKFINLVNKDIDIEIHL